MDKFQIGKMILESTAVLSSVSYFFQKYLAEPRQALERIVSNVDADLVFFSDRWANPTEASSARWLAGQDSLRRHAADIRAAVRGLGWFRRLLLYGLPSVEDFNKASALLIQMSNSFIVAEGEKGEAAKRNRDAEARIRVLLRILDGSK